MRYDAPSGIARQQRTWRRRAPTPTNTTRRSSTSFPYVITLSTLSSLFYTLGNFTDIVLHEYPSIFDGATAIMWRNKQISHPNVFASICHHLTLWRPPGDYYHFSVTFFVHFLGRGDPNFDMHDFCHTSVTDIRILHWSVGIGTCFLRLK